MGAGKSTLAGTLASRFGVRAVDTDVLVEQRAGRTIASIFAEEGEPTFRALELEAVRIALADPTAPVVSLGGGAYMTPDVRAACASSHVVYLHATPERLAARLGKTNLETRPLLEGDWVSRISALYEARDPVYRTASETVETGTVALAEIVDTLAERLNELRDGAE